MYEMVSSTTRERILLHLGTYHIHQDKVEVPYELTQQGIADAIGVSRSHLSHEIRAFMAEDEGLIEERIFHVKGLKRKRKVYFLTSKGLEKFETLRERFENRDLIILTSNGKKGIKLDDIHEYLGGENPLLSALVMVDQDGVIDLCKEEVKKEDIFVGREEELSVMKKMLDEVKKGDSGSLFIVGEPGIGKTRLVTEFGKRAREKGFTIVTGKAYFENTEPFLPFKDAFSGLDTPEGELKLYSVPLGPKADSKETFYSERKVAFFDTAQVIKEISQEKPLIVFIDDLQWADGSTLKLLHYLSENLQGSKVLILGAFRPFDTSMNNILKEVCTRMERENTLITVELKPLNRDQTKEMVSNLLGVKGISSEFINVIQNYCQGNPLYTRELIKQLMEEEVIDTQKNQYPSSEIELKIPRVVTNILERRFDQLSPESKNVLEWGSVIGESVDFNLLSKISGMDDLDLLNYVDELIWTKLWVEESDEERFRFSHALIKLAAYRAISSLKLKKMHELVASCLMDLHRDELEQYSSDIAMHMQKCGNITQATEFYMMAGEQAEKMYAQENALDMYLKALETVEQEPGSLRKEDVFEALGDVYHVLGEYEDALENFQKSMISTKESERRQRMYRKMADIALRQGDYDKVEQFVDHGLSLMGVETDEGCKLQELKGWALMLKGEHEAAMKVFQDELQLAESMDDPNLIGDAIHNLGSIYIRMNELSKAEKALKKAIEYKKKTGDERGLARSYNNIGAIYKTWGDYDKALDTNLKSLKIIEKMGDKNINAGLLRNLGNIYFTKRELDKAEEYLLRALSMFQRIGNKRGIGTSLDSLGLVCRERGDIDEALEYHQKSLDIREETGEKEGIGLSCESIGTILKEKGELEDAIKYQKKARKIFHDLGETRRVASTEGNIGEIYLYMGETKKAMEQLERCRELGYGRDSFETSRAGLRMAECYILKGDLQKAKELAKKALLSDDLIDRGIAYRIMGTIADQEGLESNNFFSEAKTSLEGPRGKKEYARCLLEEGIILVRRGMCDKGRKKIKETKKIFREQGMTYWENVCQEHL